MLTGTPLDLTPFGDVLKWIGNTVISLWLLATVWLAISRANKRKALRDKWISAAKVLAVMLGIPVALISWRATVVWKERSEFNAARAKAEALFKKRCETAGEFIYKTVPEVAGVVWMKWRDGSGHGRHENYQFGLYDPYGGDCGEESCIEQLLKATEGRHFAAQTSVPVGVGESGYDYVETTDPKDSRPYRYALRYYRPADRPIPSSGPASGVRWLPNDTRHELHRSEIDQITARYGITWDDISTREDRENWIAGGSITVVDLKTNEVVAKRIGYMMDPGLGATAGFRDPWGFASYNSCPVVPPTSQTDDRPTLRYHEKLAFVFKVLRPAEGESK